MIYQMIIRELNRIRNEGTDIGKAIKYCTENAFDLVQMHDDGKTVNELVKICLAHK
ncbi:hypothetical protein pEaSNUABM50_00551 [Erwinia phage pEa_SNUABM_50]|uniref:Uncharacterized protein n=4 Tax=Eneladusvirus BF TaxID=2560751 RepID=A0A7L8ZPY8_9CAUD|nr:hypothetical protein FDH34_gp393 [Serratia phage BF]QOI71422.1 hypothetical protein pEaSNUABM12_00505 [Erwinia phage pEa_SNUABM_12]QOI72001.1 hypothetical protein pEaSNUABM47_00552 [Erwinia phage pEa_SNUABM_47]QOI72541.1 hypothetical protein pEaSNUABM50_00551 [Erwinia phage pEa_SNUABM_50]QXO11674.1 hypothetical protein pEaSNUABM19_00563 [Erwinia phage pEa_SNUABM_19]QXO12223.1 hypothetical protein pEaSNUABM44_00562 [Erwinia phage pEa_SNUABM_44]QXO12777.1 hypothetical protein pEaSNUABM49_005